MIHRQGPHAVARRAVEAVAFVAALLVAAYAISRLIPIAGDFACGLFPFTAEYVRGITRLYDDSSRGFYYAPWVTGIWAPWVSYPPAVAQYVNTVLTLACLLIAIAFLRRDVSPIVAILALLNLPTFVLMVCGQFDGWTLLGSVLALVATRRRHIALASVAFFILAVKPTNVLLLAALCMFSLRDWRVAIVPLAAGLVSGLFSGIDWPVRYIRNILGWPPLDAVRVELWHSLPAVYVAAAAGIALAAFAWLVRRRGFDELTFSLALATNLVFSPYLLWAHYVLLLPVLYVLARRDMRLAFAVYVSSWFAPWLNVAYPVAAFLALWLVALTSEPRLARLDAMQLAGAWVHRLPPSRLTSRT